MFWKIVRWGGTALAIVIVVVAAGASLESTPQPIIKAPVQQSGKSFGY